MRGALFLGISFFAISLTGCPDSPRVSDPCSGCGSPRYSEDYTQIENLLADLELSWVRREVNQYAQLFSEDFVFVFQEDDAGGIPKGYWNKEEDSAGVSRIFDSSQVTAIRMDLTWGQPEANVLTKVHEEMATRIIVFNTFLDVDLNGGETTLRVDGHVQWFFCQMGDETKGEDPSRWYIVEWQDLGDPSGKPNRLGVESFSWGSVKIRF